MDARGSAWADSDGTVGAGPRAFCYPSIRALLASPRFVTWAVAGLAGALALAALPGGGAAARTPVVAAAPIAVVDPPVTVAPTTTTAPVGPNDDRVLHQPPPAVLPPLPPGGLGPGDSGDIVAAYQRRLADVHLDPGPIDGEYSEAMTDAVVTVQRIMGVPATGTIEPAEAAFIAAFRYPDPLDPDAEPDRTEIDVTKQLLTLYQGYQVRLITMTSTGSGADYCYDTPKAAPTDHVCAVAGTPSGRFTYYEKFAGVQDGDLGTLYNPVYFDGGIAVHGAEHVALTPQSFGCADIPMHIATYFPTLVKLGDPVYVHGGSPAPVLSDTAIPPPSATTTTVPGDSTTTTLPPDSTTTTLPPDSTTTTLPPDPTTTTLPPDPTTTTP